MMISAGGAAVALVIAVASPIYQAGGLNEKIKTNAQAIVEFKEEHTKIGDMNMELAVQGAVIDHLKEAVEEIKDAQDAERIRDDEARAEADRNFDRVLRALSAGPGLQPTRTPPR